MAIAISSLVAGVLALLVAVLVARWISGVLALRRKFDKYGLPSANPHMFLGNILDFKGRYLPFGWGVGKMLELNTDFLVVWVLNMPAIWVGSAEVAMQFMHITKAPYKTLEEFLGMGLVTSEGAQWKHQRKLFNPAFHNDFMRSVSPVVVERSRLLMDRMREEAKQGPIDATAKLTDVTLDVIGLVAFGKDLQFVTGNSAIELRNSLQVVLQMQAALIYNPLRPYTHPLEMIAYRKQLRFFHDMVRGIIKEARERVALLPADAPVDKSILSLILRSKPEDGEEAVTDQILMDQISTFLFAGHDTTAATMSYVLLYLAKHPDVKAKALAEVDQVLGVGQDFSIDYNNLASLKYMTSCIKECLRLFPIGPATIRHLEEDLKLEDGRVLPGKHDYMVNFMAIHRNPRYWPEPNTFRPERFEEKDDERKPGTYLPFSLGARNCIGQPLAMLEMRIVLGMFFNAFDWELEDRTIDPEDSTLTITLKPPQFRIILKPRPTAFRA